MKKRMQDSKTITKHEFLKTWTVDTAAVFTVQRW